MMWTPPKNKLDGCFCVLLGGRRLPCIAVEPRRGTGKALCLREGGSELTLFRTGELDVMGELVDHLVAQGGGRPRNPDDDRGGVRPVFGTSIELPRRAKGRRGDAICSRRVDRQEILPGLSGEGSEIIGNRDIESQRRRGAITGNQQESGRNCYNNHCEHDRSTHTTSLPTSDAVDRCRLGVQHMNRPQLPGAQYKEEKQ